MILLQMKIAIKVVGSSAYSLKNDSEVAICTAAYDDCNGDDEDDCYNVFHRLYALF